MNLVKNIFRYKIIFGIVFFFILAFIFEKNIRVQLDDDVEFKRVEKIINSKIKKVDQVLEDIEFSLDSLTLYDLMLKQDFINDGSRWSSWTPKNITIPRA